MSRAKRLGTSPLAVPGREEELLLLPPHVSFLPLPRPPAEVKSTRCAENAAAPLELLAPRPAVEGRDRLWLPSALYLE